MEGSARVERLGGGVAVGVPTGGWTRVGEEGQLQAWEFAAGVNLGGTQVLVDGRAWVSHDEAVKKGLKAEVGGKGEPAKKTEDAVVQPDGDFVRLPGLRKMLMSKVSVSNEKLSVKWPLENGLYQVFVWMMEDGGDKVRSLRLNVQGTPVAEELGEKQTLRAWNRFGPYRAEVKDGSLDLLFSPESDFEKKEPHLAGIAVYRRAGTGPPVKPPEARGGGAPEGNDSVPPAVQPTVPD